MSHDVVVVADDVVVVADDVVVVADDVVVVADDVVVVADGVLVGVAKADSKEGRWFALAVTFWVVQNLAKSRAVL